MMRVCGALVMFLLLCGSAPAQSHCAKLAIPPDTPKRTVTGRVIDDLSGRPIVGAVVTLSGFCNVVNGGQRETEEPVNERTLTADDGGFAFENITLPAVMLNVSKDGYQDVWPFRRTAEDPIGNYPLDAVTGPITIRLAPVASISGVVRGEDGTPMPHAWVTLWCFQPWSGWRTLQYCNSLKTASDGSYGFGPLQPGRYFLVAQAWLAKHEAPKGTLDYVPVRYPLRTGNAAPLLELREGEQAHVDFALHREKLHHITGTVTSREQWPHLVDVVDEDRSKAYAAPIANQCCKFEAWVPNGHFRLEAQFTSSDGEFIGSTPLEVAGADVSGLVFHLTSATGIEIPIEITGAVKPFWFLQMVTQRPGGYVEAGPQSTQSGWMRDTTAPRKESVSVRPGSYELAVLATGNVYAQSVSSGGTDLLREPLMVNAGDRPDPIHVVMAEGAIVAGVTRRGGNPARAFVHAIPEHPDGRLFQPMLSDENGKFRLEGLAPETYWLFASEIELPLDLRNRGETDFWKQRAQRVTLAPGKTTTLDLRVLSAR